MTEETKETFQNLGEAFNAVVDDEQQKEPVLPEEVAEVKLEETEKEQELPVQETAEVQPEEKVVTEDWESLGYPEFKGKTPKEISAVLTQRKTETEYRNTLYGQQANEVGALRKEVEELKNKSVVEKPEKKGLSDAELEDFQDLLRTDPAAALNKYYSPQVEAMVKSKMEESMASGPINQKLIEQHDAMEIQHLRSIHPDFVEFSSEMTALDDQKALGQQRRPAEELYQLAKLWKSKDPAWLETYNIMKDSPQISFSRAKGYATGSSKQAVVPIAPIEKDKLIEEVKDLQDANPKKTTKAKTDSTKKYSTVDAAFESCDSTTD